MTKRIAVLLLIIFCLSCHKNPKQVSNCRIDSVCTALFATVGIHFTDKHGNAVSVKNLSAVNQRTQVSVLPAQASAGISQPGYYAVTDDSRIKLFSADGDDVLISATDSVTNQTKTTTFKIASGDCGCHVTKLSGEDKVVFD